MAPVTSLKMVIFSIKSMVNVTRSLTSMSFEMFLLVACFEVLSRFSDISAILRHGSRR